MHNICVKNVTLSVQEHVLQAARARAAQEQRTLNQVFREWIRGYARQDQRAPDYSQLMRELRYAQTGGTWTRDERNER